VTLDLQALDILLALKMKLFSKTARRRNLKIPARGKSLKESLRSLKARPFPDLCVAG